VHFRQQHNFLEIVAADVEHLIVLLHHGVKIGRGRPEPIGRCCVGSAVLIAMVYGEMGIAAPA